LVDRIRRCLDRQRGGVEKSPLWLIATIDPRALLAPYNPRRALMAARPQAVGVDRQRRRDSQNAGLIKIVLPDGMAAQMDAQIDLGALRRFWLAPLREMITLLSAGRVWPACGRTNMRKGWSAASTDWPGHGLVREAIHGPRLSFKTHDNKGTKLRIRR
jgi:hypothetical protein